MTPKQTPCMRPGSCPPVSPRAFSAPPAGGGPMAPRPRSPPGPGHLPDPAAARGDGKGAGGADRRQLQPTSPGTSGRAAPPTACCTWSARAASAGKIDRNRRGPARETHRLLHHACSDAGREPGHLAKITRPGDPAPIPGGQDRPGLVPRRRWRTSSSAAPAGGARWLACRIATRPGPPCHRRRLLASRWTEGTEAPFRLRWAPACLAAVTDAERTALTGLRASSRAEPGPARRGRDLAMGQVMPRGRRDETGRRPAMTNQEAGSRSPILEEAAGA